MSYSDYIRQSRFADLAHPDNRPLVDAFRRAVGSDPGPSDIGHAYYGLTFENKTIWQIESEWRASVEERLRAAGFGVR